MNPIRVLIVDDSVVFRSQVRAAFEKIDGYRVVGTASNGKIALERLEQFPVDLVTLDLEMPEMSGLKMLQKMRERNLPQKIILFSSESKRGAEVTLEALKLGATDFVTKPSSHGEKNDPLARLSEELKELLVPRLTALFNEESKEKSEQKSSMSLNSAPQKQFPTVIWEVFQPKVVVIGSSTGGPTALEKIFSSIRGPVRCPILIVQHMPPVFTATLAERLGKISNIPAGEAKHLEILQNNRIYVAPGNFHMLLSLHGNDVRFILDQGPTLNFVRPSVDLLFSSAAKIYQNKCFGIILTGMGEDGKMGANEVKRMGGCVMIQNKESSVVFGMPGAVFSSGAFDKMGDLNEISSTLQEKMTA